jgi:type I restriction enzyme S subunit
MTPIISLGDAVELINGDRGKNYPDREAQRSSGYCLFLNTKNVRQGYFDFSEVAFIDEERHAVLGGGSLKRNDIVLTIRGTLGNTAVFREGIPYDVVRINSAMLALRPNRNFDPDFIEHFLRSDTFLDWVGANQRGSAQPHLRTADIETAQLPLFCKKHQQKLVGKIDGLSAKSQRARNHLDHIPRLVEKYKEAILATLLTCSKGTELSMDQLSARNAPIRYGVIQPGSIKDSGTPLIRVCDLQNGGINWSGLRRISPDIDKQYAHARVQAGDVLISVVGTIGRIALVDSPPEQTNTARAVARIRPDPRKVLPKWLAMRLQAYDCQKVFHFAAREVARKTLNIASLRDIKLTVPSLSDQKFALGKVIDAFNWIEHLASETSNARKLVDHLDQAILGKAFRGELVPQDPKDEPASVLLDRVKAERATGRGKKAGNRITAA